MAPARGANGLGLGAVKIFTVPVGPFVQGQRQGPFESGPLGGVYTSWQFSIKPGGQWPASGGQVLWMTVERSQDGGVTWVNERGESECVTCLWDTSQQQDFNTWVKLGSILGVVQATSPTDLYRVIFDPVQDCNGVIEFYGVP